MVLSHTYNSKCTTHIRYPERLNNKLGQVEKELDVIQNSIRDLEKFDLEYKRQSEMSSPNIKGVIIAVAVTLVAYTMVLYMFGIY